MAKPKGKVKIKWSHDFAYAIGLITTDGNLANNGRIINFGSKDLELVEKFKTALGIDNTITKYARGGEKEKRYFRIQFGDILFYRFLQSIGLMPNKSKIMGSLQIPDNYFFDFLRGHFDGDGTFYSYWDPRWKSSYMFYTAFVSASKKHIEWLREKIRSLLGVKGHLTVSRKSSQTNPIYQLKFAKADSLLLIHEMYNSPDVLCLRRKHLKIIQALSILVKP